MERFVQSRTPDVRDTDIVVGMDGSPAAKRALSWAAVQARLTGARLQVITAWEFPYYYAWAPMIPHDEDLSSAAGKVLASAVRDVLGDGPLDLEIQESVVAGHPAQVLVDASTRAALLVVGSRGHGGFTGGLIGSVSQQCVQHAGCPVVVVRGTV